MKKVKSVLSVVSFIIAVVIFTGCQKEYEFEAPGQRPGEDLTRVSLNYSMGDESNLKSTATKNIAESGQTIYGSVDYGFRFWLEPANENPIAEGSFEIRSPDNSIFYSSSDEENGIDIKFDVPGEYTLNVDGTFEGDLFSFDDIIINVQGEEEEEDLPTAPVRLYNFVVNGNATVDVAISKAEYQSYSDEDWFHVKREDGTNFQTNLSVSSEEDSIRFTLEFPAQDETFVEFNGGYHDGSSGGMWLTPAIGNPPSVLYNGINTPYSNSENFFGFEFHVNGEDAELRNEDGVLILTTAGEIEYPIPGNNGDGLANNYQVRWSGMTQFFKTVEDTPTFRYKIGSEGTFTEIGVTQNDNPEYFEAELPNGTSGELRFQFGTGSGSEFTPNSAEMSNSQYYEASTDELVVNI